MKTLKKYFLNDFFILYLILANAILIFIQEFELYGNILDFIEPIFTVLFIFEMFVKIKEKGFKDYISNGWNIFDFILIVVSIPSLAVVFFNFDAFQLNVFLTLRVFRVFKFFRLIKFFPNIQDLITNVKRAMKASYVVIAGFFLLCFIVSLFTCALYKNIVPEYFANPLDSFFSIFRLFSIDGWYEIPNLIAERTSEFWGMLSKFYFVILLLCGGILGLSLVNSIFVDAMISDNNNELEKKVDLMSKKIDELINKIDNQN